MSVKNIKISIKYCRKKVQKNMEKAPLKKAQKQNEN